MIKILATRLKQAYRAKNGYALGSLPKVAPDFDVKNSRLRLNFILPLISQKRAFGGVATALRFYQHMVNEQFEARIIILNEKLSDFERERFPDYEPMHWSKERPAHRAMVYLDAGRGIISLRPHDIFISTDWLTANLAQELQRQQRNTFGQEGLNCYLIQDFEPAFMPWSSNYLLAEATYRSELATIAVFNTEFLHHFFKKQKYPFKKELFFDPIINEKIAKYLPNIGKHIRKQRILIYGRPNTPRNGFEMIIAALRIWAEIFPACREWELVSLGGEHGDVPISSKCVLRGGGKAALDEYANFLCTSALGISLMASPHPSYPPLEMAAFGLGVITNNFDVKIFPNGSNLYALHCVTPRGVAEQLACMCAKFSADNEYFVNLRDMNAPFIDTSRVEFSCIEEVSAMLFKTLPSAT